MTRRKRMMDDLDRDIRDHIERETQDNIERGMPPEEARYAALRKFGNVTRVMEDTWEVWSAVWLQQLVQDVRYGLRALRRNPGFMTVATLTVALGIGANTAAFSLINAVLLRPLPLPGGERVTSIQVIPTLAGETGGHASPAQYLAWRDNNPKFDLLAAVASSRAQISGIDEPEEVRVLRVSQQLQELAGFRPYLGRSFNEDDFKNGSMAVCLISARFWQRRFSEDRGVVGRILYVDATPTAIIGVLPENIAFPDAETDLWIGLRFGPEHQTQRSLDVYGRLRSGVSAGDAQAWLNEATARTESEMPEWLRTRRVVVTPIREQVIADQRSLLLVLSGIATCVLLICCANMSNLLLARYLKCKREMALRASLGATPARLVRQILTEALLLCAAGATAGFISGSVLVSLSHDFLSDSRFKALIANGANGGHGRGRARRGVRHLPVPPYHGPVRTGSSVALRASGPQRGAEGIFPRAKFERGRILGDPVSDRHGVGHCVCPSDRSRIAGAELWPTTRGGSWLHRGPPVDSEASHS